MAYSTNPLLPKARKWAILLVIRDRLPVAVAARKAGIHRVTLWRWLRQWRTLGLDYRHGGLPTRSARPHRYARKLAEAVIVRIVYWREHLGRCASVIHAHCRREGTRVSLASVKRVLRRLGYTGRRRWQRYRSPIPRPHAAAPGDLLQTDTVHFIHPLTKQRLYLYTLVDIYSRWAYAELTDRISQRHSAEFIQRAQTAAPFVFVTIQSDNGPEFGRWLHDTLQARDVTLRHSRVRKPNDNAHIERFNRTIQDECVGRWPTAARRASLAAWVDYYNTERLHLGIQLRTPVEMLQRC